MDVRSSQLYIRNGNMRVLMRLMGRQDIHYSIMILERAACEGVATRVNHWYKLLEKPASTSPFLQN